MSANVALEFKALLHGKFTVRDVTVHEASGRVLVLIVSPTQSNVQQVVERLLKRVDAAYRLAGHGWNWQHGYFLEFVPMKVEAE